MKKIVSLVLGALLVFLLVYMGLQTERQVWGKVDESVIQELQSLTFITLDKKEVRLSDYRGKVLLLNFWAVWCPPCKEEMPIFEKVYQKYRERGFEILAVNVDSSESALRDFLKNNSYSYTIVRLKDDKELNLFGLPTSYLIDRDGTVRKVKMGVYRELEEDVSKILK